MSPSLQPSPTAHSLVGTVVAGRYRVDALLGEGGMGAVYRAEHVHMRKVVALKVLHQHMTVNDEAVQRFEREAVAAGRIEHPNVAQATDFGRLENGSFYLVLEYVAGTSLSSILEGEGALEPSRAAHVAAQVASALVAAHAEGIVHRDLKPDNVMLTPTADGTDRVKVLDFGIAKVESGGTQLTQIGTVFGTPQYMAPEQAAGRSVDARADLYALGLILYEMLTGEPAFSSDDLLSLLTQQMTAAAPPLPPEVPEPLARLVAALLVKDPEQRLQSAAEARTLLLEGLGREQKRSASDVPTTGAPRADSSREPDTSRGAAPAGPLRTTTGATAVAHAGATDLRAPTPSRRGATAVAVALTLAVAARARLVSSWQSAVLWAPILAPRIAHWLPSSLRARLEPWTANRALVVLATLGVGLLVLVGLTLGAILGEDEPPPKPQPAVAATETYDELGESVGQESSPTGTGDPELEKVIQLASRGSEPALYALSQRSAAERSDREWLAIAQGKLIRRDLPAALDAYQRAIEQRRAHAASKTMLAGLRYFGTRDDTCDRVLAFAADHLGEHGSDLLFEVWSSTSLKTRATEKALALLQRPAKRNEMTPALALALEVRAAVKCEDYARLLPRMVERGDERSYRILKQLAKDTGCGQNEKDDCFPCLRGSTLLGDALAQTQRRKAPKYESRRWR